MQCSIPAFEGLLKEDHNNRIMKLLYRTAEWHGFAKLRMHTSSTLDHLETLTKEFGVLMRQFRDTTCSTFKTTELPCEADERQRRQWHAQGNKSSKIGGRVRPSVNGLAMSTSTPSSRKPKTLNLLTPRFHSLGDYVQTIRMFGSTDLFSTQVVCCPCL